MLAGSINDRHYRDQTAFNFGFNPFSNAATGGQTVLIPDTVGGLVTDGDRTRPALNASLQWRPTPDLEFYVDGIFTGYRQDFDVNFFVGLPKAGGVVAVQTQGGGNATIPSSGLSAPVADTITTLNNFTITSKQTFHQVTDGYQFAGGMRWQTGPAFITTELTYNDSTVESTAYIVDANYVVPRIDYSFNRDGTPNITALTAAGAPFDLTDPSILDIFALFDQRNVAVSEQIAWRGDLRYDFENSWLQNFQIGLRLAHRTGESDSTGENRSQIGVSGDPYPEFGTEGPDDILGGRLGVDGFALPDTDFIRSNIDLLRGLAGRPPGPPPFAPALHFDLTENNFAFYGQLGFDFTDHGFPLDGIIGVRVVNNDTDLNAILITNGVQTPTQGHRNELDYLPSLTLRWRPDEEWVVRLVAGDRSPRPNSLN
jgi:TonB-dependent receptor